MPKLSTPIVPIWQDPSKRVRIFHGDCCKILSKRSSWVQYDLIFADPPFNIGQEYEGYDDCMPEQVYGEFTNDWAAECLGALRPGGTLCIHVPDEVARIVLALSLVWAQQGVADMVGWNIWHYRFGQSGNAAKSSKCIVSKAHLLIFSRRGPGRTWNPPMVESDRATVYGDKRTKTSETPGKRVALDVWGIPSDGPYWGRVQGNNEERWCKANGAEADHPNQLPEVYLERAIRAYSNPGDRLLCPFGGSGTETVAADALGRKIDTIEISEINCRSIVKRLKKGAVRVRRDT